MESTSASTDVNMLLVRLEHLAGRFGEALQARVLSWLDAPEQYRALGASLAAASTSGFWLLLQIIVVVSIVAATLLMVGRRIAAVSGTGSAWRRFFTVLGGAIVALAVGLLVAQLLTTADPPRRILRLWAATPVAAWLLLVALRALLLTAPPGELRHRPSRRARLVRDLSLAVLWSVTGLTVVATLRLLSAGQGLADLVGVALVALPSLVLFVAAIQRNRKTVAGAVAGPRPRGRWRAGFARAWPAIMTVFIILIIVSMQAARTLGAGLPGGAVLMTALIVMATPHLDAIIWNWAKAGLDSPRISTAAAAWRQTARFTVLIAVLALLGMLWATPLAVGMGIDLRLVAYDALKVALISCVAAFLWNLIATVTARISQRDQESALQHAGEGPRSRLGTLVPLLGAVGKSFIVAFAFLSVLVTVGVNVWPLITGLSFFGLAISFGTQALVKDVVSGLFYLLDDAFRQGEYIETSGAKGTVEKISIRSVSLRGSRGPIATVPYGQMGKIQNFSRDWVKEKIAFRVAFDTDVELVRKLFKKIGQEIAADPELGPDLIEPFKSEGISQVEDGTLIVSAKFKANPGKQTGIRRAALKAVQKAFRENGIHVVSKPLTGTVEQAPAA